LRRDWIIRLFPHPKDMARRPHRKKKPKAQAKETSKTVS